MIFFTTNENIYPCIKLPVYHEIIIVAINGLKIVNDHFKSFHTTSTWSNEACKRHFYILQDNFYDTINTGSWVWMVTPRRCCCQGGGLRTGERLEIRTPSSSITNITSTITAHHTTLGQNIISMLLFILTLILNE